MGARDLLRGGARLMTQVGLMGEVATLYPKAGGSRAIRVTIRRRGRQRSDDGRITGLMAEVWIRNDATMGITAFSAGDEIEFAMIAGGEVARHRLTDLIEHDSVGFLVRVWA